MKSRYRLIKVIYGFAVFVLKSLLPGSETQTDEYNLDKLWKQGWYCRAESYNMLDGKFKTRAEIRGDSALSESERAAAQSSDASSTTTSHQSHSESESESHSNHSPGPLIVEFDNRPGYAYFLKTSNRGRCHSSLQRCECFPPFHGLLCEKKFEPISNSDHINDKNLTSRTIFVTTTPPRNVPELLELPLPSLRNLGPSASQIPLLVFHDGPLSQHDKGQIQKRA